MLEQLTKLRDTFYVLEDWFIIKEYHLGTASCKPPWRARGGGRAEMPPAPRHVVLPDLHAFTNPDA